jgi:hypothetical protein
VGPILDLRAIAHKDGGDSAPSPVAGVVVA